MKIPYLSVKYSKLMAFLEKLFEEPTIQYGTGTWFLSISSATSLVCTRSAASGEKGFFALCEVLGQCNEINLENKKCFYKD